MEGKNEARCGRVGVSARATLGVGRPRVLARGGVHVGAKVLRAKKFESTCAPAGFMVDEGTGTARCRGTSKALHS